MLKVHGRERKRTTKHAIIPIPTFCAQGLLETRLEYALKKTEALHPDGFRQNQHALKTPVVCNGKQETIGYAPIFGKTGVKNPPAISNDRWVISDAVFLP